VQGTVEDAVATLRGGQRVELTVAGRTDRGVHAWAQVASYEGEPVSVRGLNAVLPEDVAVVSCEAAPDGFDARRDATSRTYCYRIYRRRTRSVFEQRRALHWPYRLEVELLHACAALLGGVHDFTAFTPTETDHVHFARRIELAQWREHGDWLEFWIRADAFLRNMIRVLVGTMLEVGQQRRTLEDFAALLEGAPRAAAGPTAPPHGLYFAAVGYRTAAQRDGLERGAAAPIPVEEDDEGDDRQREEDRVHDRSTGDGDDQQHDAQNEPQHGRGSSR
jgi:tRNA pseudouridine38-40 synthase